MVNGLNTELFVQAQAGAVRNAANDKYANAGVAGGVKVEKNGNYLKAEAGIGTALSGKLELGHDFALNKSKTMGIGLSANAEASRAFATNEQNVNITSEARMIINDVEQNAISNLSSQAKWHPNNLSFGAKAEMFNRGKRGEIRVGIEGGVQKNYAPDCELSTKATISASTPDVEPVTAQTRLAIDNSATRAYVTPTIYGELNAGKGFSLFADLKINQGQAGIRYTF
ncbi:hypothetical protein IJ750_01380 [bacterium]|nr:hypothetical protein [bacterium]